ncbi:MAG TPA: efflux transporter outer membrane subunit [Rickettsiales bacterium]|nr:efflux transporter outer membrane subunit [Rickettsiales bacterium]
MHPMKVLLLATATLALSSCAVGPDFKSPKGPDIARYTDSEMPGKTASAKGDTGAAQRFAKGADVPMDWWKQFGSEPLNKIVDEAFKENPDLEAATASLRQAQEAYYATRGDFLPSIDAGFKATREKFNPAAFGQTGAPASIFTLYQGTVNVSYNLDLFGGTRRALEAAGAQVDYERFELEAAYLSMTANVVTTAIQEASLREQIKEINDIVNIQREQLDLLKKQLAVGAVPKTTVLEQEATLAQTQTTLPSLEKQLAQTRNQLAVLAGKFPGNNTLANFNLTDLKLPEQLPLSLPSSLVEQRPDIRAAEAMLHTASANVGVATANMLPQISINGAYGSESTSFSKLFTSGTEVWSIGGGLLQPLFHGGTLLHEKRAAVAAYDKASAQYKSTVLQAFKNVADTLRALQYDAEGLAAQVNAEEAAHNSLDLARTQYKVGAISYPQLLDAQRTYAQARIGLVQARAARLTDTVTLFQALGGGWQNAEKAQNSAAPATTTEKQPTSKSEK